MRTCRWSPPSRVYDPDQKGFIVTFTIEEGQRYRFGTVEILSNVPAVDPQMLYGRLRASTGAVYNAEAVEKSVENLSIEVARRGYPFAVVRPRGDRDIATATINVAFVVEEGPRIYIERINIRGNTRTQRLCHPARIRPGRGRCLQPCAGRPGRASARRT